MSDLDSVQLDGAFERAAEARAAIAGVIDKVSSGEFDLAAAFVAADEDQLTGRCFAVKVFEVVPGVGKVRARRTMADIGMADDIWLGDVPPNQRTQIITALTAASP